MKRTKRLKPSVETSDPLLGAFQALEQGRELTPVQFVALLVHVREMWQALEFVKRAYAVWLRVGKEVTR